MTSARISSSRADLLLVMLGVNQVKTEPLVDGERTKQMFDNFDHRPAIAGALRGCFRRDSGGGVEDDAETPIEVVAVHSSQCTMGDSGR